MSDHRIPDYGTPDRSTPSPPHWASATVEVPPEAAPGTEPTPPAGGTLTTTRPVSVPAPPKQPSAAHHARVHAIRVLGIVVTVGLIGVGALSALAHALERTDRTTTTIDGTVTRLVTDAGSGDVRIRPGAPGTAVVVTRTTRWVLDEPVEPDDRVVNGELDLGSVCHGMAWLSGCSTDLDVTVPEGTELQVATDTGDLRIEATGSAPVSARTSTGDVRLTLSGASRVTARTNTGDVTVVDDEPSATVDATSNTGDVTVRLTGIPDSVVARTDTGDVRLTLPPGLGYVVDADTDTGDVTVDRGLRNDRSDHRVTAHTSTGDVDLRAVSAG